MDVQFTSFTDETSMPKRPPSHVEKIYERRYMLDYGEPGHDYWVRMKTVVCAICQLALLSDSWRRNLPRTVEASITGGTDYTGSNHADLCPSQRSLRDGDVLNTYTVSAVTVSR